MSNNLDVVICGAGATGLTLAIELARRGVAFRLLEQRDRPFHGSRGKGIQPRSREVQQLDLGYADASLSLAGEPRTGRITPGSRASGCWCARMVTSPPWSTSSRSRR
ncbi:FAD-dependent oxidoreductase [Stenotrophomonas sp. SRS1]|uniref:FAD-dependent oxidoreductase n=1 Tax=Stenotrophomonas sp. SRS1 TaxID=2870345 RepID=UPI0022383679|nr:FAD-dependent oxidoreductase [Stenotrophomonas sp. SRS1]MCW6026973.1 FAD-dependent oxidoreductase [Stenotrophomonas sp. SRS1]